jgi:hypothetical protein
MLIWLSIALIIIFIAIPWPFSPFANRPYYRPLSGPNIGLQLKVVKYGQHRKQASNN